MIYLFLIIAFNIGFAGLFDSNDKIYKAFDVIQGDVVSEQELDDSRWSGGPGFEDIAELISWETNNNINIVGDSNAIKGDTLKFLAGDVFPNTLRAFGDVLRDQLFFLKRTGFDSFLIREDRDANEALKALHDFSMPYQGAIDNDLPAWKRVNRTK